MTIYINPQQSCCCTLFFFVFLGRNERMGSSNVSRVGSQIAAQQNDTADFPEEGGEEGVGK